MGLFDLFKKDYAELALKEAGNGNYIKAAVIAGIALVAAGYYLVRLRLNTGTLIFNVPQISTSKV